jgi:hypothetical protein
MSTFFWATRYTRQKNAVVAAMIHGILFSLYGNCRDKIQALNSSKTSLILEDQ